MYLNADVVTDILGRVDGITVANASCVSSEFWSIARQESLWEEACSSLWPSTSSTDIKELISSLGGFRRLYQNCFPFIDCDSCERDISNCSDLHTVHPSDFVSLVDVQYKNKTIYSKVVWGIPYAHYFQRWFSRCPFKIDLLHFSGVEEEDHTVTDGLPTVVSIDKLNKDNNFLGEVMDNIKLSWILINKRTGRAANLSSGSPLGGKRHWPYDKDFVICFGSILPAHHILPCKGVHCMLVMKCRLNSDNSLKMSEVSIKLEDNVGRPVNGSNSVLILDRALSCGRTLDPNQVMDSYQIYLTEKRKLREPKLRSEGRFGTLCLLSGIVASASFLFFTFKGSIPIL